MTRSISLGNDFYSIDPTEKFTKKQLSVLKRILMNFIVYRLRSKQANMFRRWVNNSVSNQKNNKVTSILKPAIKKSVAFALDKPNQTNNTCKQTQNILIHKNKSLLIRIMRAWSHFSYES